MNVPCITLNFFAKALKQHNLCVGTVINKHWILTAATCCKPDDIVTIKFNDYSGLVQLMNELCVEHDVRSHFIPLDLFKTST